VRAASIVRPGKKEQHGSKRGDGSQIQGGLFDMRTPAVMRRLQTAFEEASPREPEDSPWDGEQNHGGDVHSETFPACRDCSADNRLTVELGTMIHFTRLATYRDLTHVA
jgi:hypothetical protein